MKKNYPYWKVIIGFTCCPLLTGIVFGVAASIGVIHSDDNFLASEVTTILGIVFMTPLIFGLGGMLLFGVPALLASLVYSILKLYRSWISYLFVATVGGVAAHVWIPVMWSNIQANESKPWELFDIFHSWFLFAALSSLLMAYFILPRKPSESAKGEKSKEKNSH